MSDSTQNKAVTLTVARDTASARALAFAIGTFLRRSGVVGRTVLSSGDASLAPVRDGLVQGLVLTGIDVVDVGVVDETQASSAARALAARGFLRVTIDDDTSAALALDIGDAAPSSGFAERVREIVAKGDFASGEGVLTVCSPRDVVFGMPVSSLPSPSRSSHPVKQAHASADDPEATARVKKAGFLEEDTWVDG